MSLFFNVAHCSLHFCRLLLHYRTVPGKCQYFVSLWQCRFRSNFRNDFHTTPIAPSGTSCDPQLVSDLPDAIGNSSVYECNFILHRSQTCK